MAETDMDDGVTTKATSVAYEEFLRERDLRLQAKGNQTARGLAIDLVKLMELLAIHGETGIAADPDRRMEYIETLQGRIIATRYIRPAFERAFIP